MFPSFSRMEMYDTTLMLPMPTQIQCTCNINTMQNLQALPRSLRQNCNWSVSDSASCGSKFEYLHFEWCTLKITPLWWTLIGNKTHKCHHFSISLVIATRSGCLCEKMKSKEWKYRQKRRKVTEKENLSGPRSELCGTSRLKHIKLRVNITSLDFIIYVCTNESQFSEISEFNWKNNVFYIRLVSSRQ